MIGKNNKGPLKKYGASLQSCQAYYRKLWKLYLDSNPELVSYLKNYNGFTDIFGKPGNVCQAIEIYNYLYN